MKKQSGFSLVELMLAIGVGLLITAGALQIFTAGSGTFQVQDEWARIQENARFSLDTITRDIRQMGFSGCLYSTPTNPVTLNTAGVGLSVLEGCDNVHPHNTSDSISLMVAGRTQYGISAADVNMITTQQNIGTNEFAVGQYAILSNCQRAELVRIGGVDAGKNEITLANNLADPAEFVVTAGNDYPVFSAIYPIERVIYALDPDIDDPDKGTLRRIVDRIDPINICVAPIRENNSQDNTVPVADGISDMQILYGQREPDGSFRYQTGSPNAGLVMDQVDVIQITLTVSPENDNIDIRAEDRQFETVITLRNR